jgi:hypothetical protein
MRANVLGGYLMLALATVLIAGATFAVFTFHATPPGPLEALRPCHPIVGGATPVYVCRTGHAYALQGGEVVDLGPVSSVGVPRR